MMNRRTGGVAALLAAVAPTGCTPTLIASTTEPVAETVEGTARVRLIGIDTPEIGCGGVPGECHAKEARTFLDELLYGQEVELIGDATQADVDKCGRLLRHVRIGGVDAAEAAIAVGAGLEYTYNAAYDGQSEYRDSERAAAGSGAGLSGMCETVAKEVR